jgi:uncharacterized protein YfiM (DUF2279 family)
LKYKPSFLFVIVFLGSYSVFSQGALNSFLKPSDSLNLKRQHAVYVSEAALASFTLLGLNELWYANYQKSKFHFINDNSEWLQVDKVGHFFTSYHFGRAGAELLQWSGATKKKQLVYGATLGFVFLTAVEVLDGFSSEWGASWGDVVANASGTALYVSQELVWKEQRIIPKFSFHFSPYAQYRPNILGHSLSEQLLKDYNGQTYWLSLNLHSFNKNSAIPKWLNIALGYGANAMFTGRYTVSTSFVVPQTHRYRQLYISLDVDLTKIKTKSHALKTLFSIFNTLKIPAPTLEIRQFNDLKWHFIYF